MQINSSRPTDFYPLTQANNRNVNRTPVVFDASKTLNFVPAVPSAARLNQIEPIGQTEEQNNARFIREFNAEEVYLSDNARREDEDKLPKAVDAYIEIDTIPSNSLSARGQYLDEIV